MGAAFVQIEPGFKLSKMQKQTHFTRTITAFLWSEMM
jgi:hypothetical protein